MRPSVSPSAIEAEGDRTIEARQRVRVIRTWWLPVLRFLAGTGAGIGVAVLICLCRRLRLLPPCTAMTADRQLDAVLLRKPPLWRRVTPHRLGFLLALVLTLPWAVDVTRTHMIRSILRDASDETTFVVYGGMERYSAMDAVSRDGVANRE